MAKIISKDKTNLFTEVVDFNQTTTPSNPASGHNRIYFKSDGVLYKLDSLGAESAVSADTSSIARDNSRPPTTDISWNSHKLTNLTDPGSAQDAATKNYVDTQVATRGDVFGPSSSQDKALVRFNGSTGKIIENSTILLEDAGAFDFSQTTTPTNPSVNRNKLYFKSDGILYSLDSSGNERSVGVQGPGSSTDSGIALWNGTSGELLKNSSVTITVSGPNTLLGTANGVGSPTSIFSTKEFTIYDSNTTNTYGMEPVAGSSGPGPNPQTFGSLHINGVGKLYWGLNATLIGDVVFGQFTDGSADLGGTGNRFANAFIKSRIGILSGNDVGAAFTIGTDLLSSVGAGNTQSGINNLITARSSAQYLLGFSSSATTTSTAFTLLGRFQFYAANTTKGSGSTITRDISYYSETPTQGTHNATITDNQSFTGDWFINSTNTNPSTLAGNLTAANFSGTSTGTNTGDVTLTAVGSSPNGDAASLSGQALTLQPADGSNPGVITAGTQTIGGNKTFTGSISASNLSGTNTGDQTITLTGDVTGSGTGSFATTVAKIDGTTVSGTTGSTNVVFSASPTLTGTLTAANANFSGSVHIGGTQYDIDQSTVNTTNSTATNITTISTSTDTVILAEARVTGRRTGGSAGSAGDCGTWIVQCRIKNSGGTVTVNNQSKPLISTDQGTWDVNFVVDGVITTQVDLQVTGATNNNITWYATLLTNAG